MVSLQKRGQNYSCVFYWGGKRRWLTLGEVSDKEAEAKADQVDYLLMRLKQGLVELPPGLDIVEYVQFDGKPRPNAIPKATLTLAMLRDKYLSTHGGAHETSTLYTSRIHFGHFVTTLGKDFSVPDLSLGDLQRHADRRAGEGIAPATIRKEVHSLRAAWNWARRMGFVSVEFPSRGLVYRKGKQKPPFQTRAEIARQVARGLPDDQVVELWDSLYLTGEEIPAFLEHVRLAARHPWIYPMACMAAHTGARRSEMIRAQVGDVDFESGVVTIREQKRVRGTLTTRRVPLSPLLAGVLRGWIDAHPGGNHLFCRGTVARSRTRREAGSLLTRNEAHDHLQRTLSGSEWAVVRGYHVLRHSFIGVCASRGIDQRFIDEWVGHQTDEQRRRYRHLAPDAQKEALRSAFG